MFVFAITLMLGACDLGESLIMGYNAERKEILYTDTWGAGRELNRMPEDWAFAITHSAFYLKPL
jgi:hypothetical protein